MTAAEATFDARGVPWASRERLLDRLELSLIYGSIILIPYDLPLLHQACLPLAFISLLLMLFRRDLPGFLDFIRGLPVSAIFAVVVCVISVFSVYANLDIIMMSTFQQQSGWIRALSQLFLLITTLFYSFYLAFCLCRHDDWLSLVIRACWWSLPIPIFVGLVQIAYVAGIHSLGHLPLITPYQEGSFRITSVARESSWFGSYACIVLPFLVIGMKRIRSHRRRLAGATGIGLVLVIFFLGFSKSAYAGLVAEAGTAMLAAVLIYKPWRAIAKFVFGLGLLCFFVCLLFILMPDLFGKLTGPFVARAEAMYLLFEPLLTGDTRFLSIGTRFGMAAAGNDMGAAHLFAGVGLGQFGFHASAYVPIWGINRETIAWLSNDMNAWPSTSNLYSRLLAELGIFGMLAYCLFRLAILAGVAVRVFRGDGKLWRRDHAVFCIMIALVAFDFHRDSFINQDLLAALGLALACTSPNGARGSVVAPGSQRGWRFFTAVAGVFFCVALVQMLSGPSLYSANATLAPTTVKIVVSPSQSEIDAPDVAAFNDGQSRFKLFRDYWGSRSAAARIIATHPDLVKAVLKSRSPVSASQLASFIHDKVIVLMADKQAALTLRYWDSDPQLASRFLEAAIVETDHAVAASASVMARDAAEVSHIGVSQTQDPVARRILLEYAVAKDLQAAFDGHGQDTTFDYIEHVNVSFAEISPQPSVALPFAFLLAVLAAMVTATVTCFLSIIGTATKSV